MTQVLIAEKLEVSKQQVSLWVTGKSYPRCEKLFELAHLLQCKVDDLYEFTEEK
ncbi:helix-turn-helix transcriptional regulator [Mechercharimyces sp. CAU 1602]|uniref:helix-turn-helix transcriptional regulator n=1 Tax=Mechercharimyces sp. CAU 1602 TaxID=2973933 RepID=UPI00216382C6|nr:helix-turn-helix transcriptional regulator [Mechercharimyces sp. CAU 1602]MCS1352425.1 helix-turn-helix domain-containing protein [Mechercharimyces sp. CAU 1602]